jgi:hypothetical protein
LNGDGLIGVDLDGVRDTHTGSLDPWAEEELARLRSYAEVSPSRTGVRGFAEGELPIGRRKRGNVEVYDRPRFLTVTGHRLDSTPATVECRPAELLDVWRRLVAWEEERRENVPVVTLPPSLSDLEVVRRASAAANGAKFSRLWAGDWSGYPSHSEGDLALAALLGFWVGPDLHRIDALFRQSGLMRPKWQRADYRQRTITRALQNLVAVREEKKYPHPVFYCGPTQTNRTYKVAENWRTEDFAAEVTRRVPARPGLGAQQLADERLLALVQLLDGQHRGRQFPLAKRWAAEVLACSATTARRAIRGLVAKGRLVQVAGDGGRRRHRLADEYAVRQSEHTGGAA